MSNANFDHLKLENQLCFPLYAASREVIKQYRPYLDEIDLTSPQDFCRFIPRELPAHFTVKQFSDLSGIHGVDAYSAVRSLVALGLFSEGERIGRSMGFVRKDL